MNQILSIATLLLPIVTGVVQLIKQNISISKNAVPIFAIVVGILLGIAAIPLTGADWVTRAWAGGLAGMSSTGLYELAFNPRKGKTK